MCQALRVSKEHPTDVADMCCPPVRCGWEAVRGLPFTLAQVPVISSGVSCGFCLQVVGGTLRLLLRASASSLAMHTHVVAQGHKVGVLAGTEGTRVLSCPMAVAVIHQAAPVAVSPTTLSALIGPMIQGSGGDLFFFFLFDGGLGFGQGGWWH